MMPVKISAVSYLNTVPLLHGLKHSSVRNSIQLTLVPPAECARNLETGKSDIALIPVAALPGIPHYEFIGDYCIGATGPVRTVILLSNLPLEEITHVYLDTESRTSVMLVQVLAKHFWKITPTFKTLTPEVLAQGEACVLIGDKVFSYENNFAYRYDLAEAWIKFSRKPFVFAAWASTTRLPESFVHDFNEALHYGTTHIPQAIEAEARQFDYEMSLHYLTHNINYSFDAAKRAGMVEFWNLALEEVKSKVRSW